MNRAIAQVYLASKIYHAKSLRKLRLQWLTLGIVVNSRWLDMADLERAATPEQYTMFWLVDEEDVKDCDILIIYGESGDALRGALVEAGIAIALGKLVIAVGDSPSLSNWTHHPLVVRVPSLDAARDLILHRMKPRWRT